MRYVSEKVVQKIKSYILCSTTFFPKNRSAYEILQKKNTQSGFLRFHCTNG
jgi:hypothetical protein